MFFSDFMICFFLSISVLKSSVFSEDTDNIIITVLSQPVEYHLKLAVQLKNDVILQSKNLDQPPPKIHFSHESFPSMGDWTIFPLLKSLTSLHKKAKWFFFCEDTTHLQLSALINFLDKKNPNENVWFGHALYDREATIIHHFAFHDVPNIFKYPNFASGFIVSQRLLKSLADQLENNRNVKNDFSIDAAHELSLYIWNKDKGFNITHEPKFCISNETDKCITSADHYPECTTQLDLSSIYMAVKSCKKFHSTRIPVVQKTWGKYAQHIAYYSEEEDNSIPTTKLDVKNVEQGHCEKFVAIIKHSAKVLKILPNIKWVVIADDDTILSVKNLLKLLSCYNATELIAIGQRYGYGVASDDDSGYNYLTGGAGMALSHTLIQTLAEHPEFQCMTPNTPDDMFLGVFLAHHLEKAHLIHRPEFHQARPCDYTPEYLQSYSVVSFHKHWMIDPIAVYKQWFLPEDKTLTAGSMTYSNGDKHTDL